MLRYGDRGNGAGRIGLANTRNRLRRLYGDRGRLELVSGTPGGTRASIEIPYRRHAYDPGDRTEKAPDVPVPEEASLV